MEDLIEKARQRLLKEGLADIMPSCLTCYYSRNGKRSCDRHLNKLKPDYSKGVECYYNNYAHYRAFRHEA